MKWNIDKTWKANGAQKYETKACLFSPNLIAWALAISKFQCHLLSQFIIHNVSFDASMSITIYQMINNSYWKAKKGTN